MLPPASQSPLLQDTIKIWKAGVAAVDSQLLVQQNIRFDGNVLQVAGLNWTPTGKSRICVVGAGKAGAGMARGVEKSLGLDWLKRTSGWINVPEDCVQQLQTIHLHGARPAGVNEPTAAGVAGTREILKRVAALGPEDLCLVLISGGGSALLPAPIEGITLDEKLQMTRQLMRCGAPIEDLNCVRRHLSSIKGGGLLRACRAGLVVSLIISDVIGDPLETIASGPTVACRTEPSRALAILNHYQQTRGIDVPEAVRQVLSRQPETRDRATEDWPESLNCVIGNNRTAVEAAAALASQKGYRVVSATFDQGGDAAQSGREFARELQSACQASLEHPCCFISGGETTVQLAPTSQPQKGGRNQEFALAAVDELLTDKSFAGAVVSGGTDGEDGPTDAAGAFFDRQILERIRERELDPGRFLEINNSYPFFEQVNGLLKTGPTHTNVMDLRVGLIPAAANSRS